MPQQATDAVGLSSGPTPSEEHHKFVIIGSGFGATMTGLSLARALKARNKGESILMLERGTWWTTPVSTVQDKEVETYKFLKDKHRQPVQFWASQNHFTGFIDLASRCLRRPGNEDGLYDITRLGTQGFWSLFRRINDGVTITRANGVGGGSLVYSNITLRPPDLIFNDPRWPLSWDAAQRNAYYDLAREAIGHGVLFALDNRDKINPPANPVNTGLSNIVTRSARLDPNWKIKTDPNNSRNLKQIDPTKSDPSGDHSNFLWLDRARVFQTAVSQFADDFGTVDSAINDLPPGNLPYDPKGKPTNYCERQGRCNVGCLPGARHTLNKQLMAAALGKFDGTPAVFGDLLKIQPLAAVDYIEALSSGGYRIHYQQFEAQDERRSDKKWQKTVVADKVIVSAGCFGTNEIMLRSKEKKGKGLPNLSDNVGRGFSTNGDYIAFLENTRERVSLFRGPVTTSVGHLNTSDSGTKLDQPRFHTIEDQGIPPAFASLIGVGVPLIRSLSKGRHKLLFVAWAILLWSCRQLWKFICAPFVNYRTRQDLFKSGEELTVNMMCVVAQGRETAKGKFTLGRGLGDTPLRVERTDGKKFYEDPVYTDIKASLEKLAEKLRKPGDKESHFRNPFWNKLTGEFALTSIATTHPLGGCRMAKNGLLDEKNDLGGVVDEFGRVFDMSKHGQGRPFYEGLYIADASFIPTALGVNPSLTISALSLRIADSIIAEL